MTAMSFSLEIYGNSSISGDDRCDQKFFKFSAHVTIGSVNSPLLPHIFGVAIDFLDRYYAFRSREISIAHGESSPVEESLAPFPFAKTLDSEQDAGLKSRIDPKM